MDIDLESGKFDQQQFMVAAAGGGAGAGAAAAAAKPPSGGDASHLPPSGQARWAFAYKMPSQWGAFAADSIMLHEQELLQWDDINTWVREHVKLPDVQGCWMYNNEPPDESGELLNWLTTIGTHSKLHPGFCRVRPFHSMQTTRPLATPRAL